MMGEEAAKPPTVGGEMNGEEAAKPPTVGGDKREAGLRCRGVTVRIADRTLVGGVDLTARRGRLLAVLGPSGAGKTTLLRAIAGLAPMTGSVEVGGRDVTAVPAHRRPVGMLFAEPRLFPALDVAENVAFALRVARTGRKARRQRAEALLAEVGLPGFADRRVTELSSGEQQRVALARALAAAPDVLLLDEPLSAVDAERRGELRRLVHETQRARNLTMLYVTHDRSEAAQLGDAVAVMLEGRFAQVDSPAEVFERPANLGVARLVGATNLLSVRVRGGLAAINGTRLAVGGADGPATFTIRPEWVCLDPESDLRLRITEVAYLGSHHRVRLAGHGLALEARVPLGTALHPGAHVGVRLPRQHLWRLPDRGGEGERQRAGGRGPEGEGERQRAGGRGPDDGGVAHA